MERPEFVGARLELARSFRGLTLTALAKKVYASTGLLSHYENGRRRQPSDDLVGALADVLKVKPAFFYQPLPDLWHDAECSFRRRAMTPELAKKRAKAHGSMIGLIIQALGSLIKIPTYNIPAFSGRTTGEIDNAVLKCREHWKLGLGPIQHIGRVAEGNGVMLVQNLWHSDQVDAFSRRGKVNVIVLNSARTSTSRWIFDIAHELGHFVLHTGLESGARETEEQAHYFAGSLLLPSKVFGAEFRSQPFSWQHIFNLKKRWCVSAAAIVRRAFDLSLIDALRYRRSYQQMATRGWLKDEPHEPDFVGPEWFASAFEALGRIGQSVTDLCTRLHLTTDIFTEITGISVERVPFRPRIVRA